MNLSTYVNNPGRIIVLLMGAGLFNWVNDETYLKLRYKIIMGKRLNLEQPQTFNEKLQWLKLNDRQEKYTQFVDKYEVKRFVGEKLGEEVIIPTLGVWDSCEDIDFKNLPNQFVLKCTHDSGGVYICTDKTNFAYELVKKRISEHLKHNFFYQSREWPYKNVRPRIIAEKYMVSKDGHGLNDYKLMCFNGVVRCLFVCTNRYSKHGLNVTFFDTSWNRLPFERHYPQDKSSINKPANLDKMITFAEKLSTNIPFVRVDFYEIDGRIYFGEMTFFPGGGTEEFTPDSWDYKLGTWIKLPDTASHNENDWYV